MESMPNVPLWWGLLPKFVRVRMICAAMGGWGCGRKRTDSRSPGAGGTVWYGLAPQMCIKWREKRRAKWNARRGRPTKMAAAEDAMPYCGVWRRWTLMGVLGAHCLLAFGHPRWWLPIRVIWKMGQRKCFWLLCCWWTNDQTLAVVNSNPKWQFITQGYMQRRDLPEVKQKTYRAISYKDFGCAILIFEYSSES